MFVPTIELTFEHIEALQAGTLKLNRGQWVTMRNDRGAGGAKGRFVGVSPSGVVIIIWRMAGESFRSFCLRFKKATAKPPKKPRSKVQQLALDLVERGKRWLRSGLERALALKKDLERAKKTGWVVYRQLCRSIEQLSDTESEQVREAGKMGLAYCLRQMKRIGIIG